MSTSAHFEVAPADAEASSPGSEISLQAPRHFRGGFRIACASSVTLSLGSAASPLRVRELSPEHVVVEWPVGHLLGLAHVIPARLHADGRPDLDLDVRLTPPTPRDAAGQRGLAIVTRAPSVAREIVTLGHALMSAGLASGPLPRVAARETLSGARARAVLEVLARHGREGTVRAAGRAVGRALAVQLQDDRVRWQISAEGDDVVGPITIEMTGHNSLFVMDLEVLQCGCGVLFTSFPKRIQRLRSRSYRRVAAPAGTFVELRHPLFDDRLVRRAVRELSAMGISFSCDPAEDLVYPEMFATEVTVESGGARMCFSAEVRSLTPSDGEGPGACGLRLLPDSAADEAAWLALVDRALHTTTETGSAWAKAAWRLFEKAGYLDLSGKSPEDFAALVASFESVSERLDAAPELGCQAVWPARDGEVDAAMSMMKTYSSSWLVYQLAKITGPTRDGADSRTVLRDLHLRCYEHAQRDPDLRWLVAIPQVKPIWSRAVHYDLPMKYVASGKAAVVRFRAVEVPCGETRPLPATLEIGEATPAEIALTLETIARTRPAAYVDALDLSPERFSLDEVGQQWEKKGFSRGRKLLVARRFGVAVAAAILESADDGVHLFRLLDSVRLFALAARGEETFGSLLSHASGYYAAMSKTSFIAYLEEDDASIPSDAPEGAQDLGLADFVVLSADMLHELLEHVYEVTAPRAPAARA